MRYTADRFALHLISRGAAVTIYTEGPLTTVTARHDGVRVHAWFHIERGFNGGMIHRDSRAVREVDSLKTVVDALGLPVPAVAGRP